MEVINITTIKKALNEIEQRNLKWTLEITVNDFTFLENNITPNQLNEYLKFTDLLITWYVNSHKELVIHENDNIFDYTIKYIICFLAFLKSAAVFSLAYK